WLRSRSPWRHRRRTQKRRRHRDVAGRRGRPPRFAALRLIHLQPGDPEDFTLGGLRPLLAPVGGGTAGQRFAPLLPPCPDIAFGGRPSELRPVANRSPIAREIRNLERRRRLFRWRKFF